VGGTLKQSTEVAAEAAGVTLHTSKAYEEGRIGR
jgi:hypothetical protein